MPSPQKNKKHIGTLQITNHQSSMVPIMESVAHGAWIWDHNKPNSRPGSVGIWPYLLVFEDSCGGDDSDVYTHEKLTWILKIAMFERRYILKNPSFLGIYV